MKTDNERKVLIDRVDDNHLRVQWTLRQGKTVVDDVNVYDVDELPRALVSFDGVTEDELQTLAVTSLKITGLRTAALDMITRGESVEEFEFSVREFLDTVPEKKTRTPKKVTLADIQKGVDSGEFTKDDVRTLLAKM